MPREVITELCGLAIIFRFSILIYNDMTYFILYLSHGARQTSSIHKDTGSIIAPDGLAKPHVLSHKIYSCQSHDDEAEHLIDEV